MAFCVLVANTEPQKVIGASNESKAMRGLLCSPIAKVELYIAW
jgi:hypothetical protein